MVSSELLKIISLGESSTVQFKERVDDAYKLDTELVAFSNSRVGVGSGYIRAFSAYPHIEMKDDVSINEFVVTIKRPSLGSNHYADTSENVINHVHDDIDDDIDDVLLLNEQKAVLAFCNTPRTSRDILRHVNVAYHPDALKLYIRALVNNGCLQMTMPDKPTSKNQHYFTTEKGKRLLSEKD